MPAIVTAHCAGDGVFILTDDGVLHTTGNGSWKWTTVQLKHIFESIEYARFSPDAKYVLIMGSYPRARTVGNKYDCECGWSVFDLAKERELKAMRTGIQNSPYDDHFEALDGPTIADTGAFVSFDHSNSYLELVEKDGEHISMAGASKLLQTYNEVGDTQNNTTRGQQISISGDSSCVVVHCTTTYDTEDIPMVCRIELFFRLGETKVLPVVESFQMVSCITPDSKYVVIGSKAWSKIFDMAGELMYAISHCAPEPPSSLRMARMTKLPGRVWAETSEAGPTINITLIRRAPGEDEEVFPHGTLLRRSRVYSHYALLALNSSNAVVAFQTTASDGTKTKTHVVLTRDGQIAFPGNPATDDSEPVVCDI